MINIADLLRAINGSVSLVLFGTFMVYVNQNNTSAIVSLIGSGLNLFCYLWRSEK